MSVFLVDREFSGLESKIRLIFGDRDLAFFVREEASPDDLVTRLSSAKEIAKWSGPQRTNLHIVANVPAAPDLEGLSASISVICDKLESDLRTKSRIEVLLYLCLRSADSVGQDGLEKQLNKNGLWFPSAFFIPSHYRGPDGSEIPLTKPEIENQLINIVLLCEHDRTFLSSLGRKGYGWMTLANGHMFLGSWHAEKSYYQIINAVRKSLFYGDDRPIVLDEMKMLDNIEGENRGLPVAAFVQESAIDPKITEFLKKSFAEDYSEALYLRLKDRFTGYFEEGPSERAKLEVTEYLKRTLGKGRNFCSLKEHLPIYIEQLRSGIEDTIPLERLMDGVVEEVRANHLTPLGKKISELRKKIIRRSIMGAGVLIVLISIGILGLKTSLLSMLNGAQFALAMLIGTLAFFFVSRHQIASLNRSQGVLRGILNKYESKRRDGLRAALLKQAAYFLEGFHGYLMVVSDVLDEESSVPEVFPSTKYLEMVEGHVPPGYLEDLQTRFKEALLERVFKLWNEDPGAFRIYYSQLKKNFKDRLANDLERESIELLSRHFGDYEMLNAILTSLPIGYVPARDASGLGGEFSRSVFAVSRDIILATDRLVGKFEFRQLDRRNTIIFAHFLPLKKTG